MVNVVGGMRREISRTKKDEMSEEETFLGRRILRLTTGLTLYLGTVMSKP